MALVLEVEYLTGTVFAATSPGTEAADWPPQPDRIFSALVASWAARGQRQIEGRALEWLEALPAPLVKASKAAHRTSHVSFVPPNDPSSDRQKHTLHVMPQLRNRQPRRFPAVRPEDPCVRLLWPAADADDVVLAALAALAADTSYVGHSASLTRCRFELLVSPPSLEGYLPARRSVYPGRLQELRAAFAAGRRPGLGMRVPPPPVTHAASARKAFSDRWLILESADDDVLPDIRATALVAKAVRDRLVRGYHAAGLGDRVPVEVSGRTVDGKPAHVPHLAIVPLAFAGLPHADGHLLGFGLVPPRDGSLLEDPDFLQAMRLVFPVNDALGRRVLQLDLYDPAGNRMRLNLSPTFDPAKRSCDPTPYITLEGRPARTFATVTPIVLDRYPKAHGPAREAEIADLIAASCVNIGLPEPTTLTTAEGSRPAVIPDRHSAIEGAPPAEPSGKSPPWTGWRSPPSLAGRPLTHAVLQFAEPVEGPVILGAGRYFGLGLCRPIPDRRA